MDRVHNSVETLVFNDTTLNFTDALWLSNDAPIGEVLISGVAQKDLELTGDVSGLSDADGLGAFSYQWLRGGVAIAGATALTYRMVQDDVGQQLSLRVSYVDGIGFA